jgi:hypothetical protein
VFIPHEDYPPGRDAEMLCDALLKFVLEYLRVAVNNKLTVHRVKHHPSPRPFLILAVTQGSAEAVCLAPLPAMPPTGRNGRADR